MLNVVFMGTPDFAKESLKCLYEANYNILGVVTNPDKPKGRGMKMMYSPVKEYAIEKNLKIYQPLKVRKNEEFLKEIKNLNPDVICVVAYGKILPKELLDIPKYGCINVHSSLLPKYRGAAPIQWAVINGDTKTGVTTMYMDEGMDTGDMLLKHEVEIGEDETTGELWNRLSTIGGKLLIDTLKQIEEGSIKRQKQGEEFSIAPMLQKEIAKIDWENKTAIQIKNLVRGLNPIMGAYTYLDNKKIKFWKVKAIEEKELLKTFPDLMEYGYRLNDIAYGTVILSDPKKGLIIKAKAGYIQVLEIQGENAKKMPIGDFLRGNSIDVGKILQ
ncbi:MAG: methionyl-tRNA formyltransferase [Clostridia bacterium]|nr:methionyl-tRNA formyltransferase [Clostridia bacterium]